MCILTLQILHALQLEEEELRAGFVEDFVDTDEYRYYVEDAEVMYMVPCKCSVWWAASPSCVFDCGLHLLHPCRGV